jgi:hypothetical protein
LGVFPSLEEKEKGKEEREGVERREKGRKEGRRERRGRRKEGRGRKEGRKGEFTFIIFLNHFLHIKPSPSPTHLGRTTLSRPHIVQD